MENASKALLIAGGVIIALLVLIMLLYMMGNLSTFQKDTQKLVEAEQLRLFNSEYTNYQRDNVRGTELLSLLNKVIDYNARKADVEEIKFQPITVNVTINNTAKKISRPDGTAGKFAFAPVTYTVSSSAESDLHKYLRTTIKPLEDAYTRDVISKLASSATALFDVNLSDEGKMEAVTRYNSIVAGTKTPATSYAQVEAHRGATYTYYEFTQFKRAHFRCTGTKINEITIIENGVEKKSTGTGRIIEMNFEFTGKLN